MPCGVSEKNVGDDFFDFSCTLRVDAQRLAFKIGFLNQPRAVFGFSGFAVEQDPLQVIGDEDVVRQCAVFLELVGLQLLVEIGADGFHLNIAQDHALGFDLEIRCAESLLAGGFVHHLDAVVAGLGREVVQQVFKCRPAGVLGLLAEICAFDFLEIVVKHPQSPISHHPTTIHPFASTFRQRRFPCFQTYCLGMGHRGFTSGDYSNI